jgi:hypothetical protein
MNARTVLGRFTLAIAQFGQESAALLARSRCCLIGRHGEGVPTRPSAPELLPALARGSQQQLVATRAPIGVPPARSRCISTSYVTSSQPDSGADDTEALPAGRWSHLLRLTESPTPVEVAETTHQHATPRHSRRQTALPGRSRAR